MTNPSLTILVVEDDFSIRETMREALESEGYHVLTAQNGSEGLEKIRHVPKPCLVLIDMMMPIMNGREFLDVVLADSYLAAIPVLVVSAIANADNTRGAKAYIKKPLDLDLLLQLVAKYASHDPACMTK